MLLGVFVVVIEAQKLEVHCGCIHKQNCMVEKLSEIQFTDMSDDTLSISIIIYGIQLKIYSSLRGCYIKKMLVRLNMHATCQIKF